MRIQLLQLFVSSIGVAFQINALCQTEFPLDLQKIESSVICNGPYIEEIYLIDEAKLSSDMIFSFDGTRWVISCFDSENLTQWKDSSLNKLTRFWKREGSVDRLARPCEFASIPMEYRLDGDLILVYKTVDNLIVRRISVFMLASDPECFLHQLYFNDFLK
jgi:hypothetical protein